MNIILSAIKSIKIKSGEKKAALLFCCAVIMGILCGRVKLAGEMSPFGCALIAAGYICKKNINFKGIAIGVLLSCFLPWDKQSVLHLFMYGAMLCTFFVFYAKKIKITKIFTVVLASGLYFCAFLIFDRGLLYYRLTLLFEAIICAVMIFVFLHGIKAFKEGIPKKILKREEILSLCFMTLVCVMGLTGTSAGGIYIRNIFVIFIALLFAYAGGSAVGCAVGLVLGFGAVMAGGDPYFMANAAAGGFVAGLFCRAKKIFACVGFILANALMTFYTNYSVEVIIPLADSAIASGIFMLLPNKAHIKISKIVNVNIGSDRVYESNFEKVSGLIKERIEEISGAFRGIAEIFEKKEEYSEDKSAMINYIKNRVCKNCQRFRICYGGDKKAEEGFAEVYEEYNCSGIVRLSDDFENNCIRSEKLRGEIDFCIRNFEAEKKLRIKTGIAKRAAAQQIAGICEVIEKIGEQCETDIVFEWDIERAVRYKLESIGVKQCEITAKKRNCGVEIYLKIKSCGGMNACSGKILQAVSEAVGRKMTVKKGLCTMGGNYCDLKFVPKGKVHAECCGKSAAKFGNEVCGDEFFTMVKKDGKTVAAICDGMGSGKKAKARAQTAKSLAEKFFAAGFENKTILETVNKIMLISGGEESYSTIDICEIDGEKGECTFMKTGAPPSFIIRKNKIIKIEGESLPCGILEEIEPYEKKCEIFKGDIIILLSDGITDIAMDTVKFLQGCVYGEDTRDIVKDILEAGIYLCGGKAADDMTALAIRIF